MIVMADTYAIVWFLTGDPRLGRPVRSHLSVLRGLRPGLLRSLERGAASPQSDALAAVAVIRG